MLASVVICTLNRPADLVRVLRYFERETYPDFEVIIVDQSDFPDREIDDLVDANPRFRHIKLIEKGLCKSRNIGIRAARGDIVIFVDDDVEIFDGFLAAHIDLYADQTIWGSSGPVFDPLGGREVATPHDMSWMPGCNMVIRRSVFDRIGMFDEFFEVHCDDSDISHRIKKAGGRIRYAPGASLIHHATSSGGTRNDAVKSAAYVRKWTRSAILFDLKVGGDAEHDTRIWQRFRKLILSRQGYRDSRIGVRQIVAFAAGVLDGRREYKSREADASKSREEFSKRFRPSNGG